MLASPGAKPISSTGTIAVYAITPLGDQLRCRYHGPGRQSRLMHSHTVCISSMAGGAERLDAM